MLFKNLREIRILMLFPPISVNSIFVALQKLNMHCFYPIVLDNKTISLNVSHTLFSHNRGNRASKIPFVLPSFSFFFTWNWTTISRKTVFTHSSLLNTPYWALFSSPCWSLSSKKFTEVWPSAQEFTQKCRIQSTA